VQTYLPNFQLFEFNGNSINIILQLVTLHIIIQYPTHSTSNLREVKLEVFDSSCCHKAGNTPSNLSQQPREAVYRMERVSEHSNHSL
jgi:hypothetical protein